MIRHLFRLVWNRRKRNGLIMAEILVSFLLLCALFTMGSSFFLNWNEPLGFEYEDVWSVSIAVGPYSTFDADRALATRRTLQSVIDEIGQSPDVVAASVQTNVPYTNSRWQNTTWINGEQSDVGTLLTSVGGLDVLRFELIEGRWLEGSDAALEEAMVVLTQDFAEAIFPNESALGQLVPRFDEYGAPDGSSEDPPERVVGVVRGYRGRGEHRPAEPQIISLLDVETHPGRILPRTLLIRVRPGADLALEERLLKQAERIAPGWTFTLDRMEDMRSTGLRSAFLPLVLIGTLCGFLILMVGLGLIGVLWQSVVRRTEEIGVRRAMGATAQGVRTQILGELLAVTSIAVLIGSIIYLQFPLLGLLDERSSVVALALGASLTVMYAFVVLCGLYPSWLATRIEPARALGYE